MKRLSLLLIIVCLGFVITSCAREEGAAIVETKEEGMLGTVLSEREPTGRSSTAGLMVADFNSGIKPSNIGGDFGAWDKDPADFSQTCADSFDSVNRHGHEGFGVKLDYDVDSSNPAYNGFWMKLGNLDASAFKNLTFYVKGDSETGYTTVFKVELKNEKGEVGKFYATGVDSGWKAVSIPLNRFQGIRDFSGLTEFVIVFEDYIATNKDGIIYIDDIQFTK